MAFRGYVLGLSVGAALLAACGGSSPPIGAPGAILPPSDPQAASALVRQSSGGDSVIQHVVIIMQQDRSMDNLFYGYPKADTQPYGYNEEGQKIPLKPVGLQAGWGVGTDLDVFLTGCNGTGKLPGTNCRMNGFDKEYYSCGHDGQPACPNANPPYSYVPHAETKPYFAMAEQYVLADKMFASNLDLSSFVSHQYIIAAQADRTINYPMSFWGCSGGLFDQIYTINRERRLGPEIRACFNYITLGKELDNAKLSWRYYTVSRLGSAYAAVDYIYHGPDWKKDVISPPTRFLSDVKSGKLAVVSWITPTCANSDESGCVSDEGPSWVASLVNAVGESRYWNSTAIFIFWDAAGGWYDHVPPPYVNYDGLGMRVPLLVISAFAKQNYVSHVQYEHGSMLKFIEQRFGLPPMSASDTRANSPEEDCFDFSRPPRKFTPIPY